eukprot:CAMPEP_0176469386 /NCGR_PEP_ID=MMETSP0127-20121128/39755_1 /TAXON_ID=938130 /ORGANISM="Platyophrya macrostoma, Strain WH" /LENGTH=93 /DNA_ID=CAMNT_0017863331 /DNA_START=62 /DNA_END=339 /DNA_ORIENTATION=+
MEFELKSVKPTHIVETQGPQINHRKSAVGKSEKGCLEEAPTRNTSVSDLAAEQSERVDGDYKLSHSLFAYENENEDYESPAERYRHFNTVAWL